MVKIAMQAFQRHSALAHAAYVDLLTNRKDEAVSALSGTPIKKTRGDKSFWYDSYCVGTSVKTRYIGPDGADVRERLARIEDIRSGSEQKPFVSLE